ncbi:MAG TPA: hypothetical protein VI895_01305 [Bdellovibrionota bacterium]|nr:hypothetical protein [Bdellovibrionota bacterium]
MPKDEFEFDDPNVLVGMPMPDDPAANEEMARTIIEEYARFGHPKEEILKLFESPFYLITHQLYKAHGRETILRWIHESTPKRE